MTQVPRIFGMGLLGLLLCGSLAQAASMQLRWAWTPDPANTMAVDKYMVLRQVTGGAFAPVCTVTPPATTCLDAALVPGSYCWKAQAWSGTVMAPESASVCATVQAVQFIGTLILQTTPLP